jgi:hypothetical protein
LRLGIFNINTLLITLLLLSSTSTLTYISFQNNLSFSSPFLYVFIQLISLAFFVFFVSKLRWVWVTKKCIYICYPLRFKLIKSDLKKIRSIKWRIDNSVDGIYYRQFSFITENQKSIILDDLEMDLGIGAGAGYEFENGIFFNARYVYGMSNIVRGLGQDDWIKNNNLQFSTGYRFQ